MANIFKKIGRGVKKFAKSKVGKVVLGVAGAGAALVGGKIVVNAIQAKKAAKLLAAGKGVMKGKAAVKKSKGIFGGLRGGDKKLFGNGIERLAGKIKKKAGRKQGRIDRKSAKLAAKQADLSASLTAAEQALGPGGVMAEQVDDRGWLESGLDRVKELRDQYRGSMSDDETPDFEGGETVTASGPVGAMGDGAKKVLIGGALLGGGYLLGKSLGFIK